MIFIYSEYQSVRDTFNAIPITEKEGLERLLQDLFNRENFSYTLFGDPKYSPLVIHSVHFVADHKHPETIAIQEKYGKMRGETSAIYSKGNFLEITLSKMTEE